MVWVIIRRRGVSSERRLSSCSSFDNEDNAYDDNVDKENSNNIEYKLL